MQSVTVREISPRAFPLTRIHYALYIYTRIPTFIILYSAL